MTLVTGDLFRRVPIHPLTGPRETAGGSAAATVTLQAHVELLELFLRHRSAIVESIQGLLNAQRKPIDYRQDAAFLFGLFEDCFFTLPSVTAGQARLKGQLEEAHWASGFKPRDLPGLHNGLIDPAEMMVRGFFLWERTRWPGRNGRVHYAHTLFNLYVVRCLELLTMRVWDAGTDSVAARMTQVQRLLDQLWATAPADQPIFVRDARWLLQLAQSPATDDLGAYLVVAALIADTIPLPERVEIHRAGVCLTGGHLRSQIRYHSTEKSVPLEDAGLVLSTRNTNALDFALLVQDLVPLLDRYEHAVNAGDEAGRLPLADAICQGVSPDPDLFVTRVGLLGAYSMIEHLFVTLDQDGRTVYTPMGRRHVELLSEYDARIGRVAAPLFEDCQRFRPIAGAYSPYGVLYGFASDLLGHMALRVLLPEAVTSFALEDVFAAGDAGTLAWVDGWRKLPHLPKHVQEQFAYPQQFAEDIFGRIEDAFRRRASGRASAPIGRLFIASAGDPHADAAAPVPDLPIRYIHSSDAQLVAAGAAQACDEQKLLTDRREGKWLVSYRTSGGWTAIGKSVLTDILGAGRDARITGLPPAAAATLTLLCPAHIAVPGTSR